MGRLGPAWASVAWSPLASGHAPVAGLTQDGEQIHMLLMAVKVVIARSVKQPHTCALLPGRRQGTEGPEPCHPSPEWVNYKPAVGMRCRSPRAMGLGFQEILRVTPCWAVGSSQAG